MEDPSTARVLFYKAVGKVGEAFVEELDILLETNPDVDLLIVNPFQSYFGGDCGRNADLSRFFRTQLDPVIRTRTISDATEPESCLSTTRISRRTIGTSGRNGATTSSPSTSAPAARRSSTGPALFFPSCRRGSPASSATSAASAGSASTG
jgi:hypothetical protein